MYLPSTLMALVLAILMSTRHELKSSERRAPQWRNCLYKTRLEASLQDIVSISDCCERAQTIVCGAIHRLVMLQSIRKWVV